MSTYDAITLIMRFGSLMIGLLSLIVTMILALKHK